MQIPTPNPYLEKVTLKFLDGCASFLWSERLNTKHSSAKELCDFAKHATQRKRRKPTTFREAFPKTQVSFGSETSIFEVLWLCFARNGEVAVVFSSRDRVFWKVHVLITLSYVFYGLDVKIGNYYPPIPICVTVRWPNTFILLHIWNNGPVRIFCYHV